jgi:imidazolonepropionase-like amidohydrolase
LATIEAAMVMRKDKELGSITPGKFADVILVSGDPTKNISDIRRVDVVIKNGEVYRPAEMYPAFGIRTE